MLDSIFLSLKSFLIKSLKYFHINTHILVCTIWFGQFCLNAKSNRTRSWTFTFSNKTEPIIVENPKIYQTECWLGLFFLLALLHNPKP